MKRDDLIKLLAWRLGDKDDVTDRAIAEMDFVQTTILEEHAWLPWFLQKELAATTVDLANNKVDFPDDFLLEIEDEPLYIVVNGESVRLTKGDHDVLKAKYPGIGQPKVYAVSGLAYCVFPIPEQTYSVELRYYGKDVLMSADNVETPWLKYASDVVLAQLGETLSAQHYKDTNSAAAFTKDLGVAWQRLYAKHIAMVELNQSRLMGGNT